MEWITFSVSFNPFLDHFYNIKYTVHAGLTRAACSNLGITDKHMIYLMVKADVDTDKHDANYDWARHFDGDLGSGDTRANFAADELKAAIDAYNNGDFDAAYQHLGTGLHSIQDTNSHKGWGAWNVTHTIARDLFGYDVDDPKNDPAAYDSAIEASIQYLNEFNNATDI